MSTLSLHYDLAELPSSQHRAGLAGVVLMLEWLARQPGERRGVAKLTSVDAGGASIEIDEAGLAELCDEVYAAASELTRRTTLLKGRDKNAIAPAKEESEEYLDKRGRTKTRTVYYYPAVVPRGAFLLELDPTAQGDRGLWIKLWRDAVWSVFRGIPAQRAPFKARAEKASTSDARDVWRALNEPGTSQELPSTYFLGAQACTADNVPMRDTNRFMFLLHFWPFAVPVYVPRRVDNEGNEQFDGFAVAIPDISDLKEYCADYPGMLRHRSVEPRGYRPRGCLVDLVDEVGLDTIRQLRARLGETVARSRIADVVLGVDVFHLVKEGNNVRVRAFARVDPGPIVDEYTRIRDAYWNPRFRQVRLRALLAGKPWFYGFTSMLSTTDYRQTFQHKFFRRDCREAFERMEANMSDEIGHGKQEQTSEELVYRLVGTYLVRKLKSKHGLIWDEVKEGPQRIEYAEKKEKLAKDAFLAVRSRTGADFVEYFAGTLCSVPQHVGETGFAALTRALMTEPEKLRTLTLLALSARA